MASPGLRLDQPPVQPPAVTAQLNAGAASPMYQSMAASLRKRLAGGAGGSEETPEPTENPQGELLAQAEAIRKVVEQMSKMNSNFAPWGDRILEYLSNGLNAALKQGQPGVTPPPVATAASSQQKPQGNDFVG